MALVPITPPPGVITNGTDYANKGRWVDSDLIRFQNGVLRNIGGWEKLKDTALTGSPTALYTYNTNDGDTVLAVGTREKIYVLYNFVWYDITPSGFVTPASTDPLGYGAFTYGSEDYGDARSTSGLSFNENSYAFDNWGEYLIFCCSSDGKLYQWRPDAGSGLPDTIAAVITNAPTGCNAVAVSNERHIIAIGSNGDPRQISWSSREASTTWTAASTNTAGDLQIPTGGHALSGIKWQTDMLIFTDTGIGKMYFTGQPFIYGISDGGTNCKAISARAIVSAGNFIAWLGENAVFIYDGSVRELPCPVHDFIFDGMHQKYRKATCGGHNSSFNEIWWFFPAGTNVYPNKYVIFNYLEQTWSVGEMDRGCYVDEGVFDFPIACDNAGYVYQHESTTLFNSPNLGSSKPYAKTGAIQIGEGDKYIHATQIIPDSEANTLPGVTLSFEGKFTPLGDTTDFGSFTFDSDGYTDCRFSARQIMMTVTGDTNQDFQLGKIRLNVAPGGRR